MRNGKKEFKHFLYISLVSASEVETQLIIAYNLKHLTQTNFDLLILELNSISRMLQGLIKSIDS